MLRMVFAFLLILPVFGQDSNVECKCRQVDGQEYACKCTVLGAGMTPPAFDFVADFSAVASSVAKPVAAKSPASSVLASDATPKPASTATNGTPTGKTTATGKDILVGPRGGQYHISASGKKVYERKKK